MKHPYFKNKYVLVATGVALLVVISFICQKNGILGSRREDNTTSVSANNYTKGEHTTSPPGQNQTQDTPMGDSGTPQKNGDAITKQTTKLISPTGVFVSNHHPKLGNQDTLLSNCSTTPGATCEIIFTKGDITKNLSGKQADAGGTVYWSWKLGDLGLTVGSWKITVRAALNNQVSTVDDALNLEVGT